MGNILQGRGRVLKIVGVLFLVIALPVALWGLTQNQDIRQRASTSVTAGFGSNSYNAGVYGVRGD